jgi:O-antigen/teichoic acid export membrane protein
LPYAVVYNLSKTTDTQNELQTTVAVYARMVPVMTMLVTAVYISISRFAPSSLLNGLSPLLLVYSWVLCLLYLYLGLAINILVGLQDFRWRNRINLVSPLLLAVSLMAIQIHGSTTSPLVVLSISILSTGAALLLTAGYIRAHYHVRLNMCLTSDWKQAYVAYGLKFYAALIAQSLNYRLDTLILNALSGSRSVGIYAAGVGAAELLLFVPNAVSHVLYPKIASLPEENRDRVTVLSLGCSLYMVLIGGIALAIVLPWMIPMLYGKAFAPAIPAAYWLVPGMLPLTVVKLLCHVVAGYGRPAFATYITAFGMLATVVFDLWLIPRAGIVGAAVASTVAYGLSAVAALIFYLRIGKLPATTVARGLLIEPASWLQRHWRQGRFAIHLPTG